ncbi:hypothetical protein E3N88_18446 [Mikania micrantha]|uniref:ATP-dependent DNA helicase n=1 Tax=Mikania micrantha TaxID=192012 RepID=A0A5N6NM44_9ASTR|nr:hypothetical protein E3N88_18446 [Mikania micrantha]
MFTPQKRKKDFYSGFSSTARISSCTESSESASNVDQVYSSVGSSSGTTPYLDHGDCSNVCEYCSAFFWFDERLVCTSGNQRPRYNHCCKGGRVALPYPRTPPLVLAFVYGHGGTGKTFLWTTIICALRSKGKIVLAVAASGIASLLLPSGRTAHSRFKIPFDLTEESICYIKKKTQLAQLLGESSLIIWDEAPMNDRKCFESLDRCLRDILDNSDTPFGGKSVLLGGDFCQTLPIIPRAAKATILRSSLPRSYLWKFFIVYKLTENMRLHRPNLDLIQQEEIRSFSSWLLSVGDGKGDAIEAVADLDHEVYFDSVIVLQTCYIVNNYISVPSRTYMPSVQHEASLRIGKRATFKPLFGKDLPCSYYKFASYNDLEARMEVPKLLTDYIGRIERTSGIIKRAGKTLQKITILDESGHVLEITLWGEKALEVHAEDSIGKVLAITSAIVTQFRGNLQLESTTATTAAISPPTIDLQSYMERFKSLGEPSQHRREDISTTIADLKSKDIGDILHLHFQCNITISEIQPNRTWYYVTCSECTKRAYPQQNDFVCEDDGLIPQPRFMYCLNTTVIDGTGNANAVFFNDALTQLLKISCKDMVLTENNRNPRIVPKQITAIVGTPLTIKFNMKKDGSIAVNNVEKTTTLPPTTPDPKLSIRRTDQGEPSGKKSKS